MPGYEVKFTIPLDKSFECPVCLTALRDPVQVTPCGHRVCNTCIKPILRNKRPRCPLDNLALNPGKVFSDNGCHRQILDLEIFCSHYEKGCEWKGQLHELERHLEGCSASEVSCPKNCGGLVERRRLDDHYTECVNRMTACEHCSDQVVFSDMNLHLQSCASFPISCPLKCGVTNLNKESENKKGFLPENAYNGVVKQSGICFDLNHPTCARGSSVHMRIADNNCDRLGQRIVIKLTSHVNTVCPLLMVPCKFVEAGCHFKTERQKMAAHLHDNVPCHLVMLCDLVCEQKKQLSSQNERIQLQKEHIQLQKDALFSQREELMELRSRAANGEFIWKIPDFNRKLMNAKSGRASEPVISEAFYTSPHGYKMCAGVWLNGIGTGRGRYISVGLQVQAGEFDAILKWPLYPRYTFTLLDQCDEVKARKDIMATFEPQCISRPSVNRQLGKGARRFVLQEDVCGTTYCKDNTIFIKFSVSLKPAPSGFFKV